MKKSIGLLGIIMMIAAVFTQLSGQKPETIVYQGALSDMEGEVLSGKDFRASLAFIDSDGQESFVVSTEGTTGDYGIFEIPVENIPPEVVASDPYRIRISVFTNGEDQWLMDGEFDLEYTLSGKGDQKNYSYELKRFEGLILEAKSEGYIWQFTDLYPFAYLSSRFMISFTGDITDPGDLKLLCEEFFQYGGEMDEESDEMRPLGAPPSETRSRGLKGGFAVGGYKDDDRK